MSKIIGNDDVFQVSFSEMELLLTIRHQAMSFVYYWISLSCKNNESVFETKSVPLKTDSSK